MFDNLINANEGGNKSSIKRQREMLKYVRQLEQERDYMLSLLKEYRKIILDDGNACDGIDDKMEELFNDIWMRTDDFIVELETEGNVDLSKAKDHL